MEDGTPKLLDFGIAKQLQSQDEPASQTQTALRFTRAFAAPEQLRREPVGVYTDVYSLGVILYELLAGKPPYESAELERFIESGHEPPKPSTASTRVAASKAAWSDLDVLCLKAIRKDVSRRYHSVLELTQDISSYLAGKPIAARPDRLKYRLSKFAQRNQRGVAASALTLAAAVTIIAFFTFRLAQ